MARTPLHPEHILETRLQEYAQYLFENGMIRVILDDEEGVYYLYKLCGDFLSVRRLRDIGPVSAGEAYLRTALRRIVDEY